MSFRRLTALPATLLATLLLIAMPASAQDADLALRVKRLESQVKALQRQVFPGSAGESLQPEVSSAAPPAGPPVGTPASSALADAQSRLTALEGQVAALTDQTERATYSIGQMERRFAALDARIVALEAKPAAADPDLAGNPPREATAPPTTKPTTKPATPAPKPATDPARAARVAAVPVPKSDDPADDRYVYGYRLWAANLYPEARAELARVPKEYPKDRRASWALNLLGRAYLDEGLATKDTTLLTKAAESFFDNYQKNQDGERTPDSLYYLGRTLTALKEKARACDAYGAFEEVYGTTAAAGLRAQVAQGKKDAGC